MKAKKMKVKEKKVKKDKIKDGKMIKEKSEESERESNVIQIPIEEFEKFMNVDKKNEIIDLLTNDNHICSMADFNDIKDKLAELCQEGNLELIKILLRKTINNYSGTYTFKIDKTNQTASLFKVYFYIDELVIPRKIQLESKEYLITSVCGTSRFVKTIYFPENSAVKTIYKTSIPPKSNVKEIYIPASLKELRKGWNDNADNLRKFIISPSNDQFQFKDDSYLVGKSDEKNDEFDSLLFALRDIKKFSIPSNIKIISSYAFHNCHQMTKVEIPTDSNLQIIESHAFSNSYIKSIFIPPKVSKICESAFSNCYSLKKVKIPKNSNLQIIESHAFSNSYIKSIFIPPKVSKICESAFSNCYRLKKVKIPKNSNLQTIESNAFSISCIKKIYFPASLKELKNGWCCGLFNLTKIKISRSNNHFKFKKGKYLVGKSDEKNDEFDALLFACRDINKISISSKIKIISSYAFYFCKNLTKVKLQPNSNLQAIESFAFENSGIESFSIPSKITKIREGVFLNCRNLANVEIQADSNLQTIESIAFANSKIESIFIPSKVSKI